MRVVLLVIGFVLGVGAAFAYGMFGAPQHVPVPQPVAKHAPMTVTLDESFLTALMQRAALGDAVTAPGVAVPRTQVRAELKDDLIIMHANVEVLGQPTEGTVSMKPVLENGRLKIEVVQTNLGAISLPAMDDVLAKQINDRLSSLLQDMPVTVTSVRVEPYRGLTVTCQVDLDHLEQQTSMR